MVLALGVAAHEEQAASVMRILSATVLALGVAVHDVETVMMLQVKGRPKH